METACQPAKQDRRAPTDKICSLIRECYPHLQQILPSPYVDGNELYDALVSLGHGADVQGPGTVGAALGTKGMGLPVANIRGKPKHYLPRAMPAENLEAKSLSEQLAVFAGNVQKFGNGA